MPRYRLRVPAQGDVLYSDGPDPSIVADTIEVARDCFRDYTPDEQEPIYLHAYRGRCEILYKRDIDNGDGHDGAEPGDTTVWYGPDDPTVPLADNECRVWELGCPRVHWEYDYTPPEPVDWRTIPVGAHVWHKALGSGKTVSRPRRGARGRGAVVDCRFTWPQYTGPVRTLYVAQLGVQPTRDWPGERRRVTVKVAGDVVAEHVTPWAADILRDLRIMRLDAEWEAETFAAYLAQPAREVARVT